MADGGGRRAEGGERRAPGVGRRAEGDGRVVVKVTFTGLRPRYRSYSYKEEQIT